MAQRLGFSHKPRVAGYKTIHQWINTQFPRIGRCDYCGRTDRVTQWCSAEHRYTRNIADWFELCVKCHRAFDGNAGGKGKPKSAEHRARLSASLKARAPMTHCRRGHPFDDENTLLYRGKRWCRACQRYRRRRQ